MPPPDYAEDRVIRAKILNRARQKRHRQKMKELASFAPAAVLTANASGVAVGAEDDGTEEKAWSLTRTEGMCTLQRLISIADSTCIPLTLRNATHLQPF